LGDVERGFLVAERVEVVLEEAGGAGGVEAVIGRGLGEVGLDGADAELQESGEFFLIPGDGLGFGEIENGVGGGQAALGVADGEAAGEDLGKQRVLRDEVG
jgi:hypothetical protein